MTVSNISSLSVGYLPPQLFEDRLLDDRVDPLQLPLAASLDYPPGDCAYIKLSSLVNILTTCYDITRLLYLSLVTALPYHLGLVVEWLDSTPLWLQGTAEGRSLSWPGVQQVGSMLLVVGRVRVLSVVSGLLVIRSPCSMVWHCDQRLSCFYSGVIFHQLFYEYIYCNKHWLI